MAWSKHMDPEGNSVLEKHQGWFYKSFNSSWTAVCACNYAFINTCIFWVPAATTLNTLILLDTKVPFKKFTIMDLVAKWKS